MGERFDRLVAHGQIGEGGKLTFNSPEWLEGMLARYKPCDITILLERQKNSPTTEQWGYLWGVVYVEASKVTGHTPEELHEIMKSKFLRRKKVWRGTEITTVRGASDLTMDELASFIDQVILAFAEMEIAIPPADFNLRRPR